VKEGENQPDSVLLQDINSEWKTIIQICTPVLWV